MSESVFLEELQKDYEKIHESLGEIVAKGETLLFGRSFAWLCRKEHQNRIRIAEAIRQGRENHEEEYYAVADFLKKIKEGDLPINLSRQESDSLAKSLQDIRTRCIGGRPLKMEDPLYYLCAGAIVVPYNTENIMGYAGIGLRVSHALLSIDNPTIAREKIKEYLLR